MIGWRRNRSMPMGPQYQSIPFFNQHAHWGTHRQADLGRHMTKRKIGQHGYLEVRPQPLHDAGEFEALVVGGELKLGELAQHNSLLTGQHPRMQQLREHAFNAVRVFCDVFQKQHATVNLGEIGRSEQRDQHRQIAPPQDAISSPGTGLALALKLLGGAGKPPTHTLPLPLQHVVKTGQHDVVQHFCTQVFTQSGTGPGVCARLGQDS